MKWWTDWSQRGWSCHTCSTPPADPSTLVKRKIVSLHTFPYFESWHEKGSA